MNTRTYFEEIGAWPDKRGRNGKPHAVWPAYVSGFILSLIFTLAAYFLAIRHSFALAPREVMAALIALAVVQLAVQLVFFFHLGRDAASRERVAILAATTLVVGILVSGTVWIMLTLDSRMMPDDAQMQLYMNTQAGL